ncbi:N-formylglutamate amidohydrolase [Marinoscillum sp.]|uniref:N-formylglutamate amidohydrolase n=1 Tax=Marinoscillum sp. TaxID=2024838 RepID=UPI003BAD125E
MKKVAALITCEHASNQIPSQYQGIFSDAHSDLQTHLGWDPGALNLARIISGELKTPLITYDYSRLLIEVNRSLDHPQLFSRYSTRLPEEEKEKLKHTFYQPYRDGVEAQIGELIDEGHQVVHLSVHTFTPVFFGQKREVEIGFLFDTARVAEADFCLTWYEELSRRRPLLVIRNNEPYAGADDGFTTYLRTRFSGAHYLGLELEVSQKFDGQWHEGLGTDIAESFHKALAAWSSDLDMDQKNL